MTEKRQHRLHTALKERAVQFGKFTLASGATSDVYVDGRLFTLTAQGAELAAAMLWEKIAPLGADAIGGPSMGADPIVGALLHYAGTKGIAMNGFLVRKEPKSYGTKKCVEGPRPDKERPKVVVVEDTFTTGGSCMKAVKRVREEWNAEVIAVFGIVDREEGAAGAYAAEGIPFETLVTLNDLRS